MQQFLIVRRDDLIHFGIQWSNFQLEYEESLNGKRPRLVAMNDARIMLTFPPQVIAEEVYNSESGYTPDDTAASRISGNSIVVFEVPKETPIDLTAEGILSVLRGPGISVVSRDASGNELTAIEIPLGLIVSAVPQSGIGSVVSDHPVIPISSESGVTGLWYAGLKASDGDAENAGLALIPLRNIPNDIVYYGYPERIIGPPLVSSDRERIIQESGYPSVSDFDLPKLPRAKRLELSMLGGSLSTTAKWPTFEWDHEVVLGRDKRIRKLTAGVLFPFGHKAFVEMLTERVFVDGKAVLTNPKNKTRLVVTETVVDLDVLEFPFDKIEILDSSFNIDPPELGKGFYIPKVGGVPLRFPIRCVGTQGDVSFNVPLVFASQEFSNDIKKLEEEWGKNSEIPLPGVSIDIVRDGRLVRDGRRNSESHDVFEVHELSIESILQDGKFLPKIKQMTVELPVLRELMNKPSMLTPVKFTEDYKNLGVEATSALEPIDIKGIEINFTDQPDRSGGLMAPKFFAKQISRTMGPIPPVKDVDVKDIFKDATLLGLPLAEVIGDYNRQGPPKITPVPGNPAGAKMEWENLLLKNCGPFRTNNTTARLCVERSASKSEIRCEINNFDFVLPQDLVTLKFGSLVFMQKPGSPPNLEINGLKIQFNGELNLVQKLLEELPLGNNKPTIRAATTGISANYNLALPSVNAGTFLMRNISFHCGVNIPFSQNPVTMSLGFGRRDNPFNLSVMMFGGGGYIDVEFGGEGLNRLEACMEFGGMAAVNFVIGSAEVHALGGIRFLTSGESISLDAFIRIGGSVEVLGIVSVSVELAVTLTYKEEKNCLLGRATLVIEVDLPLFSESVTIDSGTWKLCGSDARGLRDTVPISPEEMDRKLTSLLEYYEAFEPV